MLIIPLAPSGCPTPICCLYHSSTLYSVPTASMSQALKSETLYPQLSEYTPVHLLSADIYKHKLIFSSWPSNPLSTFLLAPQIQPPLTIVCIVNYIYLLTYLLTFAKTAELIKIPFWTDSCGPKEACIRWGQGQTNPFATRGVTGLKSHVWKNQQSVCHTWSVSHSSSSTGK